MSKTAKFSPGFAKTAKCSLPPKKQSVMTIFTLPLSKGVSLVYHRHILLLFPADKARLRQQSKINWVQMSWRKFTGGLELQPTSIKVCVSKNAPGQQFPVIQSS